MGWMWTRLQGKTVDHLSKTYTYENEIDSSRVLKMSVVGRKVAYAAVEYTPAGKKPYVYAAVILVSYAPKSEYNFGYKVMDETAGPTERECPRKILELLSPVEDFGLDPEGSGFKWAKEWREDCWKRLKGGPKG